MDLFLQLHNGTNKHVLMFKFFRIWLLSFVLERFLIHPLRQRKALSVIVCPNRKVAFELIFGEKITSCTWRLHSSERGPMAVATGARKDLAFQSCMKLHNETL